MKLMNDVSPVPVLRPLQRVDADADAAGGSERLAAAEQNHASQADRRYCLSLFLLLILFQSISQFVTH